MNTTPTEKPHSFTPGRWHFGTPFEAQILRVLIGIGNGSFNIGYASITGCVPLAEAQANAKLIAAAPDLLAACEAAEKFIGSIPAGTNDGFATYSVLKEAIAKAI